MYLHGRCLETLDFEKFLNYVVPLQDLKFSGGFCTRILDTRVDLESMTSIAQNTG